MKKKLVQSSLFLFVIFSIIFSNTTYSNDISEIYFNVRSAISKADDEKIKTKFKDVTFVFLPGILSETSIADSNQPLNVSIILGDYFRDYMNYAKEMGLKYKRIIVESEDPVSNNAAFIEAELSKIEGDIVIISHSKGGPEFLSVIMNNTKIKNRTKGWITMQSPFYGAYIADVLGGGPILGRGSRWIFDFFGGSIDGLLSISMKQRQEFHKKHQEAIAKAMKGLRFIHYRSSIADRPLVETPLEFTRDHIEKKYGKNDGLVELRSTHFPFGDSVIEEDVDHLTTVLDYKRLRLLPLRNRETKNWNFNKVNHFKSLLLLLNKKNLHYL
ncbi:hypothetical protein HBN50_09680 [Halobacteriovorax sp. GB3]|uniref:hypothetical protein n=1 Tax=Halobacteriovorax sp. GB3 TaxID=2719615 RepID=UPI002361A33C|nr:hypothetical protein [Halobacteriovorax sp. GB3]MDD0853368.1 hypothetical protein [Halobacteriovorax sp. GB3]